VTCKSALWMMVLVAVAAGVAAPGEALAVPARRLARRGVIVVPPPGAGVVGVPAPGPAPIVIGPALRPRRRILLQPGPPFPAVAPAAPRMTPSPSIAGRQPGAASRGPTPAAPVPAQTTPAQTTPAGSAKPGTAVAAAATPTATVPEQIPTPRPTPLQSPAAQPTVAAAAASRAEMVAFTPAWYAMYPQAWRPAKSPADCWQTADVATVNTWLGQPVRASGTTADDAGGVVTAGGADDDDVAADGLRSVLVLPAGHQNAVGPTDADWLPLGVFAVVSPGSPQSSDHAPSYQQLAVDRQGTIKGNFYDAISGTVQPIAGVVDRGTLMASWTVGTNGSRFTAPVRAFTAVPRTVSMSSGGQSRGMELMPVQRP